MEANETGTKALGELYRKIATQVVETIPEECDKFKLYSEIDKYSDSTMFYYYPKNSKEPIYSLDIEDIDGVDEDIVQNNLSKLSNLLRDLWDDFIRNEREPWTNLTFELDAEGDFTIDYDYTNLDVGKYDQFERVIIWKYEHLGILPKAGRDDELSMVEAYIAKKNKRVKKNHPAYSEDIMISEANQVRSTSMESLYQEIANQVNNIIPEDWSRLLLYSEMDQYRGATFFYYYPVEGKDPIYSLDIEDMEHIEMDEVQNVLSNLNGLLRDLWNEFIDNKQEAWKSLNLSLNSEGKFNIQYSYDDLEKDGYDYIERVKIWKYEKLDILPNIKDVSGCKLIEKYKKDASKKK